METSVAVSVIIPAFNAAETLDAQLRALSQQQWGGTWEVVVADNGSTDDTVARAALRKDDLPALRVVDASGERGPSFARNVGARVADGDYLLFVDADDIVEPGWLAHMAEAAIDHPLIAGSLHEVGAQGQDAEPDSAARLGGLR